MALFNDRRNGAGPRVVNKPISVFHDRRMSPNEQVQAANNTRRAGGSQAAQSRAVRRRVVE